MFYNKDFSKDEYEQDEYEEYEVVDEEFELNDVYSVDYSSLGYLYFLRKNRHWN